MKIPKLSYLAIAVVLLATLAGCQEKVTGYEPGKPPSSAPQQNDHVPPGERGNATKPSGSGH